MNFWYVKPTTQTEVTDGQGGYKPSQPAQKYRFVPVSPPRVDNKNQPWYGGPRWFGDGPDTQVNNDVVSQTSDGTSQYFMSDVWGSFAKWFGGNTAKQNLKDTSNTAMPGSVGSDNNRFLRRY